MSEKNNKYTPNLRFPEFSGEWEEKTLGEVCDSILTGFPFKGEDITDDASGHPILRAFSIGEGIIRHGKDYDKYYPYDAEKLKKYEVRKSDIVISMDGSVGKNIAMISEKEERNLLIQRVARLRITDYPIHLIFQQIISQRFKDYAAGEKKGAVIAHISQKQIELFPIYIPNSPAEQQKIASCLSTMDDLIAAQAEKVEALKEKKTGLMQQLFPQPGETTPRLRFPEFTGEWVEKNINDCFEFKQGVQCPVDLQALQKKDGYIRFIRIIDLTQSGEPPRYIADPGLAHHICKEDLFMVRYGSPGLVGYGYEGVIANNLFRLLPKFDMCTKFFKDILTALHKNIAALCGIGALPAINFSTLGLLRMSLPPTIAEQEKIADCLSALDDQIAAETEKLTALKDYNKGLMQQLFPQPAK